MAQFLIMHSAIQLKAIWKIKKRRVKSRISEGLYLLQFQTRWLASMPVTVFNEALVVLESLLNVWLLNV